MQDHRQRPPEVLAHLDVLAACFYTVQFIPRAHHLPVAMWKLIRHWHHATSGTPPFPESPSPSNAPQKSAHTDRCTLVLSFLTQIQNTPARRKTVVSVLCSRKLRAQKCLFCTELDRFTCLYVLSEHNELVNSQQNHDCISAHSNLTHADLQGTARLSVQLTVPGSYLDSRSGQISNVQLRPSLQ
jgi:hypothetical protein